MTRTGIDRQMRGGKKSKGKVESILEEELYILPPRRA